MPHETLNYDPDFAVCPGETILETIHALGITQKEFASRINVSEKHLISLLKGENALTNAMALRLENATGTPARLWNAMEARYRSQLSKLELSKEINEHQDWIKSIPFTEIVKRGYCSPTKDLQEKYFAILKFFGVANYQGYVESRPTVAFRKGATFKPESQSQQSAMETWLRFIEIEALKQDCPDYNKESFATAIDEIRKLTELPPSEFNPKIQNLCYNAGVIFLLEPEIKGAAVNGAVRWIRQNQTPVICMNLRGRYNDIFWFTFFHEAGHLLAGKKGLFIDTKEPIDSLEEAKANEFAMNILFPVSFREEMDNIHTEEALLRFASKINLHPGCVAGQLAHQKRIPYQSPLLRLREKFEWEIQCK